MAVRACGRGSILLLAVVLCCAIQIKGDTQVLEPCGNVILGGDDGERMDNKFDKPKWATKWFAWGQLYSYCKYNVTNNSYARCWDDETCAQCMSVCRAKDDKHRADVCDQCTNEACKKGCEFFGFVCNGTNKGRCKQEERDSRVYDGKMVLNTNRSLIDTSNLPDVKSNVTKVISTSEHIFVSWDEVLSLKNKSLPSVYLIAIKEAEHPRQMIIGLIEGTNFTLRPEETLCKYVYGYPSILWHESVSFSLAIYPVNQNGPYNQREAWKKKISINATYAAIKPVAPISKLEILDGYPVFRKDKLHRPDVGDVLWRLKWSDIHDKYVTGAWYKYEFNMNMHKFYPKCTGEILGKLMKLNSDLFKPKNSSSLAEIRVHDPLSTDSLLNCKGIKVSVRLIYGTCFLSKEFTKVIEYQGCQNVTGFPHCIVPTTSPPSVDTFVSPKSIEAAVDLCGECSNTTFHVDVAWKPYSKFHPVQFYHLWYRMDFETSYRVGEKIKLIGNDTSSRLNVQFDSSNHENGARLCMIVHARTPRSNDDVYLELTTRKEDEKCVAMTIPDKPLKSHKPIVIAAVAIVGSVGILALLVKIYRDRQRSILQEQQLKEKNTNNVFLKTDAGEILTIIPDEWEIYPEQILLKKRLGEGAFGTVHSARIDTHIIVNTPYAAQCGGVTLINEKVMVAVKLLKEGAGYGDGNEVNEFRNEIEFMKGIGFHPNIVNMVGCSTIKQPLMLVVEYLSNGDLLRYLRKQRPKHENNYAEHENENESKSGSVSVGDMMSFAWQIAGGMEYLASRNIVHRDLAARNVLVSSDKRVKISDFGLSRQAASNEGVDASEFIYVSKSRQKLPFKWMSIEAIYEREFSTQSDVWAYGVVLFEIVTLGGAPYPLIDNMDTLYKMLKSGYRMERPENCSAEIHHIMRHCWNQTPQRRPTFTELREHLEKLMQIKAEYFSLSIDFTKAYYNVASFKSLESEEEEEDSVFTKEYYDRPIQLKVVDNTTKVLDTAIDIDVPNEETTTVEKNGATETEDNIKIHLHEDTNNGVVRYISQNSLKSLSEFDKTPNASYDNAGFHYSE